MVKSSKLNALKTFFKAAFYEALVKGLAATVEVPVMQPGDLSKEANTMNWHYCPGQGGRHVFAAADGHCSACRAMIERSYQGENPEAGMAPIKPATRKQRIEFIRESRTIVLAWMDRRVLHTLTIGPNTPENRLKAYEYQRRAKGKGIPIKFALVKP